MIEKHNHKKNQPTQYYSSKEIRRITIKYSKTGIYIKIGENKLII
jgi:hypothetical protein